MDYDSDSTECYSHASSATEQYMSPPQANRLDIWGPIRLCREARFDDILACTEWCMQRGLIFSAKSCRIHRIPRVIRTKSGDRRPSWYCGKCNDYKPIMVGSIFEDSQLDIRKVLMLVYSFAHDCDYEDARANCVMDAEDTHVSSHTISHWYSKFREYISAAWMDVLSAGRRIGGYGRIVEIDEAQIQRRKYNRGRLVQGVWVVGAYDTTTKEVRMEIVKTRDKETLSGFIHRNVDLGTTIHTDCWRGYNTEQLGWDGYSHHTVNHSTEFVSAEGVHTQHIESNWRSLRRMTTPGGVRREDLADRLLEFCWRKKIRDSGLDIFPELIKVLRASKD